jgi:hypothetical protein
MDLLPQATLCQLLGLGYLLSWLGLVLLNISLQSTHLSPENARNQCIKPGSEILHTDISPLSHDKIWAFFISANLFHSAITLSFVAHLLNPTFAHALQFQSLDQS